MQRPTAGTFQTPIDGDAAGAVWMPFLVSFRRRPARGRREIEGNVEKVNTVHFLKGMHGKAPHFLHILRSEYAFWE
jgi:hypothetical protein